MHTLTNQIIKQYPKARHLQHLWENCQQSGLSFIVRKALESKTQDEGTSRVDWEIRESNGALLLRCEHYIAALRPDMGDFPGEDLINVVSDLPKVGAALLASLLEPEWEERLLDREWAESILSKALALGPIPLFYLSLRLKKFDYHRVPGVYRFLTSQDSADIPLKMINLSSKDLCDNVESRSFDPAIGYQFTFQRDRKAGYFNIETGSSYVFSDGKRRLLRGSSSTGGIGLCLDGHTLKFDFLSTGAFTEAFQNKLAVLKEWADLFLPPEKKIDKIEVIFSLQGTSEIQIECNGNAIDWEKVRSALA